MDVSLGYSPPADGTTDRMAARKSMAEDRVALFIDVDANHVTDDDEANGLRNKAAEMCEQIQPGTDMMQAYRANSLA